MSQSTRCPACHARFKVVADQLRISDGWVRCGECGEIFDATSSLEILEPPELLPDLNLESLRGPVEKAKPEPVSDAWHVEPAESNTFHTYEDEAAKAGSISEHRYEAHGAFADHSDSTPAPSTPTAMDADSDGASAAAAWAAQVEPGKRDLPFDQPDDTPTHEAPPIIRTPSFRAGLATELAPWRLRDAPRVDIAVDEPENADGPGVTPPTEPLLRPWESPPETSVGYELPGSPLEDAAADERLAPVPAPEPEPVPATDAASVFPASTTARPRKRQWFDREEPEPEADLDLALFFADSAPQPENEPFDDTVPAELQPSERTEPYLEAEKAQPEPEQPRPEPTAEQPQWLPDVQELHEPQDPQDPQDPPLMSGSFAAPEDGDAEQLGYPEDLDASHDALDSARDDFTSDAASLLPEPGVEPAFVRHARRRAFWMRPSVRAGLASTALVLVLLLTAQVVLQHRDYVAARFPQTRPTLLSACEVLGCTVAPFSNIGAIVVEGSSFNRVLGDEYMFLLTLRNASGLEVRVPGIELTLTDVQDQPVVRRVLAAQELNLPRIFLPRQEWSGEIPVTMASGTTRIAGFRVTAFYPN